MSAYIIFHYNIKDVNKIDQLSEKIVPVNKKYAAEIIVGSPVKAVEGDTLSHIVIYKFESFEAAQTWYYSDEHQEISKFRKQVTDGWCGILPDCADTERLVNSGYFDCRA